MMIKYLKATLFVFSFFICTTTVAQYGDWDAMLTKYKGLEIGFSKGIAGGAVIKTTYKRDGKEIEDYKNAKNNYNWGIYMGHSGRLASLGRNQALGIDFGTMINLVKFTPDGGSYSVEYTDNSGRSHLDIGEVEYTCAGFLLSLDYKIGSEATWDRENSKGRMFALGVGLAPKIYTPGIFGGIPSAASLRPYIKAEYGFFLGIAFKVRATYFTGEQVYADNAPALEGLGYYHGTFGPNFLPSVNVSTGSELMVSLLIMPFSRGWTF
ncbi:MAG: hypothetical protein R2800_07060 [Flavipsychrobacter sp.]